MGRHPVDDHADFVLVAVVDEVHEVFRRTISAGRCKITDRLISPATCEGMFGDRHQFEVRVIPSPCSIRPSDGPVLDSRTNRLARWQIAASYPDEPHRSKPVASVDSIDSAIHPGIIIPVVLRQIRDNRCGAWRQFGGETARVTLVN